MSQPLHQAALISSSTTTSGCGDGAAAGTCASKRRDGSARAASAQADVRDRHVHLGEDGKCVAQTERHALENGADDVSASVTGGQAQQSGTRLGIEVRRTFAHQIRRP